MRTTSLVVATLLAVPMHRSQAQSDSASHVVNLQGPRVGVTALLGHVADKVQRDAKAGPLLVQFGWQQEQRMWRSPSGTELLWEGVVLIGGVEQNTFLPSLSMMMGIRSKDGMEVGFGPNLSLEGVAYAFAVGATHRVGELNVPLNVAIVPNKDGVRLSFLTGFNVRM